MPCVGHGCVCRVAINSFIKLLLDGFRERRLLRNIRYRRGHFNVNRKKVGSVLSLRNFQSLAVPLGAVAPKWLMLHPAALPGWLNFCPLPPKKGAEAGMDLLHSALAILPVQTGGALCQAFQPDTEHSIQQSRACQSHPPSSLVLPLSCPSPATECIPSSTTTWQSSIPSVLLQRWPPGARPIINCHGPSTGSPCCPGAINVLYGTFTAPSTGAQHPC